MGLDEVMTRPPSDTTLTPQNIKQKIAEQLADELTKLFDSSEWLDRFEDLAATHLPEGVDIDSPEGEERWLNELDAVSTEITRSALQICLRQVSQDGPS